MQPSFPTRFPPSSASSSDPDASTRATDTDASLARLSAITKGYLLDDPYTSLLLSPKARTAATRPPLINIGTWARTRAMDALVQDFLHRGTCQIVSLGAGTDSRFWRIAAHPNLAQYVEIDFAEVTSTKAMSIRRNKTLSAVVGTDALVTGAGTGLSSSKYHLFPADLRLPLDDSALGSILSPTLPTLLLFECVLAYLPPPTSERLLHWFRTHSGPVLGAVVYEMFGLDDPFGRVMKANLSSRSISLPGVAPYTSFDSLATRFTNPRVGFTKADAVTLKDVRRDYVSAEEKDRVAKLEMLDEIEELELVLAHYAVTWGMYVPPDSDGREEWLEWGLKKVIAEQPRQIVNIS